MFSAEKVFQRLGPPDFPYMPNIGKCFLTNHFRENVLPVKNIFQRVPGGSLGESRSSLGVVLRSQSSPGRVPSSLGRVPGESGRVLGGFCWVSVKSQPFS
jgi:hypothetical protein